MVNRAVVVALLSTSHITLLFCRSNEYLARALFRAQELVHAPPAPHPHRTHITYPSHAHIAEASTNMATSVEKTVVDINQASSSGLEGDGDSRDLGTEDVVSVDGTIETWSPQIQPALFSQSRRVHTLPS